MSKLTKDEQIQMFNLFREIWNEREDDDGYCYCFESKIAMPRRMYKENSCSYDHVLEKSKYDEYKWEKWNIIIVHPSIHNQKGTNIDKCPKIQAYRNKLIEKLGL